jgi:hypothetical protein
MGGQISGVVDQGLFECFILRQVKGAAQIEIRVLRLSDDRLLLSARLTASFYGLDAWLNTEEANSSNMA